MAFKISIYNRGGWVPSKFVVLGIEDLNPIGVVDKTVLRPGQTVWEPLRIDPPRYLTLRTKGN